MNSKQKSKCSKELYCQFLLAAQNNFTCTQLANLLKKKEIAHDSVNRWLLKTKLTPKILWEHVEPLIDKENGYLIADDTVLDKPYGEAMELVRWQYSGTHHRVIKGIGLESLLWTNGQEHLPTDFRLYAPDEDGYSKHDHFQAMILLARHRGFRPKGIIMDTWYASLANLKFLDKLTWLWYSQLRKNRIIALAPHQHYHLEEIEIPKEGRRIHLRGYGTIKVFKLVINHHDIRYYATNNLNCSSQDMEKVFALRWKIEEYHRGLKQVTGTEHCQARKARIQRTHIFCSILAFLALEVRRLKEKISWYEAKRSIVNDAISRYLQKPFMTIPQLTSA